MKIKINDLEYNSSSRRLVAKNIQGRRPSEVTVVGHFREVSFVLNEEEAISNEFWDGEFVVLRSVGLNPPMSLVIY